MKTELLQVSNNWRYKLNFTLEHIHYLASSCQRPVPLSYTVWPEETKILGSLALCSPNRQDLYFSCPRYWKFAAIWCFVYIEMY